VKIATEPIKSKM